MLTRYVNALIYFSERASGEKTRTRKVRVAPGPHRAGMAAPHAV